MEPRGRTVCEGGAQFGLSLAQRLTCPLYRAKEDAVGALRSFPTRSADLRAAYLGTPVPGGGYRSDKGSAARSLSNQSLALRLKRFCPKTRNRPRTPLDENDRALPSSVFGDRGTRFVSLPNG